MTKLAYDRNNINTNLLREDAQRLLERLENIPVIPPRNGKKYSESGYTHSIGNSETVQLTERQGNLAKCLGEGDDDVTALVRSGFNWFGAFKHRRTASGVRKALRNISRNLQTPKVLSLKHYLQYDPAKEMHIDAQWLLNEQVELYKICKEEKKYTQAAKILNDISYHVDVDARATNKISVENAVDYAKVLSEAEERVIDIKPELVAIDGEVVSG